MRCLEGENKDGKKDPDFFASIQVLVCSFPQVLLNNLILRENEAIEESGLLERLSVGEQLVLI